MKYDIGEGVDHIKRMSWDAGIAQSA